MSVSGAPLGDPADSREMDSPLSSPLNAGFSPERLGRLDAWCRQLVTEGKYSGLVVLLARDGKIFEWDAFGYRDKAASRVLARNDIHAIASLSKIVTTVGALRLVEEGRLTLREPISRHLPEFADVKVFLGGSGTNPILGDVTRPITLHDLLTHTAGFYGGPQSTAPPGLHELVKRDPPTPARTLRDMARQLARIPLQSQPGEAWIYGPSTDLVGALIEKVSGMPFDQYLRKYVFLPLRMTDTGFEVPPNHRQRQVAMDVRQENGTLKQEPPRVHTGPWPSGGGGLFSTPHDYFRFAQMLMNEGELGGVRILSRKSVGLMTRDHLHGLPKPTRIYPVSDGFGYGVEVRSSVARSQWLGTEGTFGWNGATTAYCAIDPREGLIAMIWAQHKPNAEFELYERFNNLVYQALEKTRSRE